jgi:lipid II:glycine glycyltransferase (peptidoglycan interpeptide bridge formation enzyme)
MLQVKEDLSQEDWNSNLSLCLNQNVFSTWEWGVFKQRTWKVKRFAFYKGNHFVGMTQILVRKLSFVQLGWCSSGINLVDYEVLPEIVEALKTCFNLNTTMIRFNFFDEAIGDHQYFFDAISDLKKSIATINSGYTIRFSLPNYENTPKIYSSNNRYYLGKAAKAQLDFSTTPFSVSEFVKAHNEMADIKHMDQLKIGEGEMEYLHKCFGENIFTAKVKNTNGDLLAICAVMRNKTNAYYFLAGTNEEGRKQSASFLMINKLIDYLKNEGIINFDFGGITPFKTNAFGVNRFKMGFSGRVIKYIGERDLTSSKILFFAFNLFLKFKRIG